ncbi:hypothetical protein [Saccharopolyspora sp. NPDC002376]
MPSEALEIHAMARKLKDVRESLDEFARRTRSREGERNWRVPFAQSAIEEAIDELSVVASEWGE